MWQQLINDDEARLLDALIEKLESNVKRGSALQKIIEAERKEREREQTNNQGPCERRA